MRMHARYDGRCSTCGKGFPSSALIEWVKPGEAHHAACWDADAEIQQVVQDPLFDPEDNSYEAEDSAERRHFASLDHDVMYGIHYDPNDEEQVW